MLVDDVHVPDEHLRLLLLCCHPALDHDAQIALLYNQLHWMSPTPVVALNRAVAVTMADGPHAGRRLLAGLSGLDTYHLFHAVHGEIAYQDGQLVEAATSFRRAAGLTDNRAEQRHLARRIHACG